eukprot:2368738-Amphidinium_carterae.1
MGLGEKLRSGSAYLVSLVGLLHTKIGVRTKTRVHQTAHEGTPLQCSSPKQGAIRFAADELLEDATFATEAKRQFYLLKLSMLSARSTVVAAESHWSVKNVLATCRKGLGLKDDDAIMELWHGSEQVASDLSKLLRDWPGIQPKGEITEYQLVLTR